MLARIASVVAAILTAVWLASEPGWEPLAAFVTFIFTYAGIEISDYKGKIETSRKQNEMLKKHDTSLDTEIRLREDCRQKDEIIHRFTNSKNAEQLKETKRISDELDKILERNRP